MQLYLNNHFIALNKAHISPDDRGFLLGDGLFETIKCLHGKPIRLESHWARLQKGCDYLDIPLPLSYEELQKIIAELLLRNQLHDATAGVRLTVTRGSGERGLLPPAQIKPTLMLTSFSLLPPAKSVSLSITTLVRNEFSPLTKIKSLNYLENILARREAQKNGTDEGVLLNTQGNVAETSAANIFMVVDNKVITPALKEGALAGVTRKAVIDICNTLTIPILETTVSLSQLYSAQEIFITNSLIGIQAVHQVGSQVYPGEKGAMIQKLWEANL